MDVEDKLELEDRDDINGVELECAGYGRDDNEDRHEESGTTYSKIER